jgi:hypothetical protein
MADEFKRSDELPQYRDELIYKLMDMTDVYEMYMEEKGKLREDEILRNELLSRMIGLLTHILPKLEGGGDRTSDLYMEAKKYEPWIKDIWIAKIQQKDKIDDLYLLLIRAFDKLGLSTI